MSQLNNIFGIHEQALILRSRRNELIATNIANADTPGYKARDIDFRSMLRNQVDNLGDLVTTNKSHIGAPGSAIGKPEILYRNAIQPSVDGNTVSIDVEKSEFSKNAVGYQTTFSFLNGKIKSLLTAIKGE